LASASPARLAVLTAAGLAPTVMVSGVDESSVESTDAREVCAILARMKAEAVAAQVQPDLALGAARTWPGPAMGELTLVLGCDSVLEFDGEIHGKPASVEEAVARWRRMRGRTGILHTGHFVVRLDTGASAAGVGSTEVTFADVSDDEIAAYVATGEPLLVAGSFTIDGLGGWFVERIHGDHGTVVGVSLPLLRRLVRELGLGVPALWGRA
jgi:nucleoside triphosphate pyrophosphatase